MKEQRVEPASETPADRALLASDFEEREHGAAAVPAPHRGDAGEQEEFGAPTKSSPVSVAHDFAGSSPPESPRFVRGRPEPPGGENHYANARVAENASIDGALESPPRRTLAGSRSIRSTLAAQTLRGRVAAAPWLPRGYSVKRSRGNVAAATRNFGPGAADIP